MSIVDTAVRGRKDNTTLKPHTYKTCTKKLADSCYKLVSANIHTHTNLLYMYT